MSEQNNAASKTDAQLARLLATHPDEETIEVVCRLRSSDPKCKFPSPDETVQTAECLLKNVEQTIGVAPKDYNIFRNLGYFVVSATAPFVRKMIEQKEIASASANRRSDSDTDPS